MAGLRDAVVEALAVVLAGARHARRRAGRPRNVRRCRFGGLVWSCGLLIRAVPEALGTVDGQLLGQLGFVEGGFDFGHGGPFGAVEVQFFGLGHG